MADWGLFRTPRRSLVWSHGWLTPLFLIVIPIVLVWVSIVSHLDQERTLSEQAGLEDAANLARGFGENVDRMIDGADQLLRVLRNARARDPAAFDLPKLAPANDTLNGLTLQIATTDQYGIVSASNLPITSRVDLSDREHIKVHFNTPRDDLFISKPVLGRVSNKWSIQFSRKTFDRDGQFDGVIVISLDPYYLSRFYESLEIGKGAILLFGTGDGVIRARAPAVANAIGQVLPPDRMRYIANGSPNGHYVTTGSIDGVERLFSYRRLERFGLAVAVGLATEDLYAAYRQDRIDRIRMGIGLTVFILIAGTLMALQSRRLRESRAHMAAALDNISQGIIMVDPEGNMPVVNRRTMQLLDLPEELAATSYSYPKVMQQLIEKGEFETVSMDQVDLQSLMRSGTTEPTVYERVRPNGRTLEVRTHILPDAHAVRTFTDITERKAAEVSLRQTLDRFYTILSVMPSGILVLSAEGSIEFANAEFCRLFALDEPPEQLRGISSADIVSRIRPMFQDPDAALTRIAELTRNAKPVFKEEVALRQGRILLRDFVPIVVSGQLYGRMWQHMDITALVRIQLDLRASETLKSAMLASSLDGVITADTNGVILEFNESASRMFGYKPEDAIGRSLAETIIPPATRQAHTDGMRHYNLTGSGPILNSRIEVEAIRADGSLIPVELAVTAAKLDNREIFTAFLRDISPRKAFERDLRAARDAAEAASQVKSEFLSTMSHEIRTPMNGVLGMAGLLLDTYLTPQQRQFVETLHDTADDMLRIINQVLDFSKLEAGRLEFENIPFELAHVVSSVIDLLRVKASAKGLTLGFAIAPDTPAYVTGDPGRLRQILLNLVDNGVKFTQKGGVMVELSAEPPANGVVRLRFAVRDTGIGIPQTVQDTLFQHFVQADSSISRQFGGTGLGLAICRRLVEHMNGGISIESEVGHGATFRFDVLLAIASAPSDADGKQIQKTPPALPARRRLRILLVEDNPTNRLVAVTRLEFMGQRVDAVSSGQEAIDAIRNTPYDLILMDVMMPEMDGLTATRAIRALPSPAGTTPIVAMTANVFREHERECLAAGMDGFLGKPVMPGQLEAIVDHAIAGTLRAGSAKPASRPSEASLDPAVFEALTKEVGEEVANAMLDAVLVEAAERVETIRTHLASSDMAGVSREAQALNASAAMVGLIGVAGQAEELAHGEASPDRLVASLDAANKQRGQRSP